MIHFALLIFTNKFLLCDVHKAATAENSTDDPQAVACERCKKIEAAIKRLEDIDK